MWATARDTVGYLSIACWLVVFTPQLITNYRRQSGDSLSLSFLFIWLVGDIFSIIGLTLSHLNLFQIILAWYYTIVDGVLILQVYYYRRKHQMREDVLVFGDGPSESQALLKGTQDDNNDDDDMDGNGLPYEVAGRQSNATLSLTLPVHVIATLGMLAVSCMAGPTGSTMTLLDVGIASAGGAAPPAADLEPWVRWVAMGCGYGSALLYIGSRVPQIYKNYQAKSCEGLSIWLFFFAVLGNSLYVLSAYFDYLDNEDAQKLVNNIPYLLGSGGTLLFDFTIFSQFFWYHRGYLRIDSDDGKLDIPSASEDDMDA
jgi:uncharacterized protein with PQ loop repeat